MIERLAEATAAFVAAIVLTLAAPARADNGQLQTPAKVSVDGSTLHVDGTIIDEAVNEVERQLQAAGNNPIRSLVIKSGGGEANAGIRFGEIVRDWKLAVTVDHRCMSSCANYVR